MTERTKAYLWAATFWIWCSGSIVNMLTENWPAVVACMGAAVASAVVWAHSAQPTGRTADE